MATCSYQALSRYDDDCSRKYRARNLDDIRVTHRQALARARLQLKCLKMLQNRQTLVDVLFADDGDDFYLSGYDDELDAATPTPSAADNPWLSSSNETTCSSNQFWFEDEESTVSSAWSTTSSHQPNHHHQVTSLSDLPESFLEAANCSSPQSSRHQRQHHTALYKQTGTPSPSSSPKLLCDSGKTKQEFGNLMNLIKQCPPTAQNFSHLIENSWRTILDAIQDPQLYNSSGSQQIGQAAIELLRSACTRNLITPEALVHLLQHGLVYSLCNAIYTLTNGTSLVCDLLVAMTSTEPAVIPYLVEVMASSKLSSELAERITVGSDSDSSAVVNFYHQLTDMILAHRENPLRPLLPQVLQTTGVSRRTLRSYEPDSTMQKYLTPDLIKSLAMRCLDRLHSKYHPKDLNLTLELLANVIKLAYSSQDEQWVVKTLACLRDLNIVDRTNNIINGFRRLARVAESSEHCSQGVSLEQASTSSQVCTQFLQFYEQYYNYLAQGYAAQLMACESASPDDQSHCSSADTWILH